MRTKISSKPKTIRRIGGVEMYFVHSYYSKTDADNRADRIRKSCPRCRARIIRTSKKVETYDGKQWKYHVYANAAAANYV